jgi:hypothetical protein
MTFRKDYKAVDERYWRYYNDCFQFFSDGKWVNFTNGIQNWVIDAYAEVTELKPYEARDEE